MHITIKHLDLGVEDNNVGIAITKELENNHGVNNLEIIDFDDEGYPIYSFQQNGVEKKAFGMTRFEGTPKAIFELHFI